MNQLQKLQTTELSHVGDSISAETNLKHYKVRISRERPACFIFLIDQSGSMKESWGNDASKSKADLVALYVNNAINEIINICQKSEPEPRPYFDVCVIGYGQDDENAKILWDGNLLGKTFVSPAELKQNPKGNGGEMEVVRRTFKGESIVKIPVPFWFEPVGIGLTPMGDAFDLCRELAEEWTQKHPNCLPPIVINITDGEQSDCTDNELIEKAAALRSIRTLYGKTLLFNAHISRKSAETVLFPESKTELADNTKSYLLYDISSMLPEVFRVRVASEIKKQDPGEDTAYTAMTYQASVGDLTRFLDIGTQTLKP